METFFWILEGQVGREVLKQRAATPEEGDMATARIIIWAAHARKSGQLCCRKPLNGMSRVEAHCCAMLAPGTGGDLLQYTLKFFPTDSTFVACVLSPCSAQNFF